MDISGFGYDGRKLLKRALSARVEEFYNKCHSKEDGKFCSGDVGDFSETFQGFFDPNGLAEKNPKVQAAGSLALRALDAVVGLEGDFPKAIAMVDQGDFLGEDEGSLGAYLVPEPEIDRGRVVFRSTSDMGQMASTVIHEMGHHLSLGMGVDRFHEEMAREGSALSDLMDTIIDSPTIKDLQQINRNAKAAGPSGSGIAGFTDYLLMPEEAFARAFAQYVTVRTGDKDLIGSLNKTLSDENDSLMQWPPSEYDAIHNAMDKYLSERGVRK